MNIVDERRLMALNERPYGPGPVLYWMHREHRVNDNWGLLRARELAVDRGVPLAVAYGLAPDYLEAGLRQYAFLLAGLREVEHGLEAIGIPFFLLLGDPAEVIPDLARYLAVGAIITDFDPLRIKRGWLKRIAAEVQTAVEEVDSRNIVPCRAVSEKKEWAARTFRPKIHRLLPEFLTAIPTLKPQTVPWNLDWPANDWSQAMDSLKVNSDVGRLSGPRSGELAAGALLAEFTTERLSGYAVGRNDPNGGTTSRLSAHLHFGMLSAQRVALVVIQADAPQEDKDAFLEQLVVRRELAENFCLHEPAYDSAESFPDWARRTLDAHQGDPRPYLYSRDELEQACTHDPLWNAAQREMLATGYMHGYLRMYWAKKILEWSKSPEEAMAVAVRLNDRWELDGRDPNGYAGLAWAIGGVHDRPWPERSVFGTVRSMSFRGARSKFDVQAYIQAFAVLPAPKMTKSFQRQGS
ncbi:deoxyribodipyrimidine photo-lyase [Desulfocurvibacter africanus]|uniref:deoxyribodipyrimidine photo-lyase n=1 Tax=Desulfocurvibacter africanus TaxID=873 RepID=UPI0004885C9A|nr:deoxyribodipyrimidine photo-lyase [Desulfocurvibacter africanus]